MPAPPANGSSPPTAPATTTTTNQSSSPACPPAPVKTHSTPPAASTSTTPPPGSDPRRTYGRDHLARAVNVCLEEASTRPPAALVPQHDGVADACRDGPGVADVQRQARPAQPRPE